jgi:hypothetical protein
MCLYPFFLGVFSAVGNIPDKMSAHDVVKHL